MKKSFPIKSFILSIFALGILTLVIYNMRDRLIGSPLIIKTADNGSTLDSQFLTLSGSAPHARELLLNGRAVGVDRNGAFTDEVILSPGYNMIEVSLKDQFGKQKIKTYQFVVKIPDSFALKENSTVSSLKAY